MRSVWWRYSAACGRGLATVAALCGLVLLFMTSSALAQSGVGRAVNTATGGSLADAVDKNLNELLAGDGSGSTAVGGTFSIIPTGRLRSSDHTSLRTSAAPVGNFAWDTLEGSAFANGVY